MAPINKDPYTVLGVKKGADVKDIKQAYRKLAKKYHPDINPDNKQNEAKFKEITAAYDFLSDESKKKRYDNGEIDADGRDVFNPFHSENMNQQSGFGQTAGYGDRGSSFFNFGDIFKNFSKGGTQGNRFNFAQEDENDPFVSSASRGQQAPPKGDDVVYKLTVPFLSAIKGAKSKLKLLSGKVIEVTIPANSEDKHRLRLKSMGKPSQYKGGAAGDALVEIHIKPHPYFERDGLNLILNLPISLGEALSGAKIKVPTLSGHVLLSIPAHTDSGQSFRLPGKGLESSDRTKKGDQIVRVMIKLPPSVPSDISSQIQTWEKTHIWNPRENLEE